MKKLISIVIPAYNEEEVVPKLAASLKKMMGQTSQYAFEVIVVEHGSKDKTLNRLLEERKKDKRFKILQLAKNVGCDGGIIAGLSVAKGDVAVVMMADLQDDPLIIPKFIKKWNEGYDVVYAVVTKRPHIKTYKKIGAFFFYRLMNIFSRGLVPENVSDFRLMDKTVYQEIARMPEHGKFFRGLVAWSGFRQIGIPTVRSDRAAGEPKSDIKTLFKVALTGMFAFSSIPLRISWIFLFLFICFSVIFFLYKLVTIGLFFLAGSFFVLLIAVQGEYIIKILEETRHRPNFIIRKTYGITYEK